MNTIGNHFVRRQLQVAMEAERQVLRLYAETCFLTLQVLHGNLSCMDRLGQLENAMCQAEQELHLSRAALQRIGVSGAELAGLGEQERLELFELHFRDPHAPARFPEGLFEAQDLRDMLNDIAGPLYAELPG